MERNLCAIFMEGFSLTGFSILITAAPSSMMTSTDGEFAADVDDFSRHSASSDLDPNRSFPQIDRDGGYA